MHVVSCITFDLTPSLLLTHLYTQAQHVQPLPGGVWPRRLPCGKIFELLVNVLWMETRTMICHIDMAKFLTLIYTSASNFAWWDNEMPYLQIKEISTNMCVNFMHAMHISCLVACKLIMCIWLSHLPSWMLLDFGGLMAEQLDKDLFFQASHWNQQCANHVPTLIAPFVLKISEILRLSFLVF